MDNPGPRTWGTAVDDVVNQAVFGTGGEPFESPFSAGQPPNDPVKSTVAALGVIEKHLVPVRAEDLGAIALLQQEAAQLGPDGQIFQDIAKHWMDTHHMRGPAGPLLMALEYATTMRQFKGATGQIVRGVGPAAAPPGGGFRR